VLPWAQYLGAFQANASNILIPIHSPFFSPYCSFTFLFPTTLCGVLVFDSVSRAPPPPAASLTHTNLTYKYNNFTHTQT